MIIGFWIVAGLTALAFFGAGLMKLLRSREALAESGMGWVESFSAGSVKLIALAEVVGAIGLVAPMLTGIATVLTPVAGFALAVLMIGAVVVHARRKEPVVPPLVLALLAIVSGVLALLLG